MLRMALLVACAALVAGCSQINQTTGPDDTTSLSVEATDFAFDPDNLTIPAGTEVMVTFRNDGAVAHNWGGEFGSAGSTRTGDVGPGESDSVTFTVDEPGEYPFWCDIPGHQEQGMEGTLVVEA